VTGLATIDPGESRQVRRQRERAAHKANGRAGQVVAETSVEIVESFFDRAIQELNVLDRQIVDADDGADKLLWRQAQNMMALLAAGLSRRQLARQWINARTGEPYAEKHVRIVEKVWKKGAEFTPRPRFRSLYNELGNARTFHYSGCYEWYTPPVFVEAARSVLGSIDVDPASCAAAQRVVQARRFFTIEDDGLTQEWAGRVFMNPPYANALITRFVDKLVMSFETGTTTAAIILTNNGTDVAWFVHLLTVASAICFPTGRLHFWQPDREGTLSQGQCVFYAGPTVGTFCSTFRRFGPVFLNQQPGYVPSHDPEDGV